MTIIEAINHVDTVKPNIYGQTEKIKWLSDIDGMIKAEIIDTHEDGHDISFNGYNEATALTQQLLAPAPYDKLYIYYLEMKIDYANNEYGKYNNTLSMYNEAYKAFQRYYNGRHKPKSSGRFLF